MGSLHTGTNEYPSLELKDFKPAKVVNNLSAFRIGDTIVFKDKKGNHYEARACSRGRRHWLMNSGWQLKFLECCIDLGSISREAYERVEQRINSRHMDDELKWAEQSLKEAQAKIKEIKSKQKQEKRK